MDGGAAARRDDRGGERIPTLRASRLRVAVTAAALALAVALATLPFRGAGSERPALQALAGLALLAVAIACAAGGLFVPLALAVLVAELGVRTLAHRLDAWLAVLAAAALLVLAELVDWALSLPRDATLEPRVAGNRLAALALAAAVAATAALLTLLGASV
jgi:hypothetical protein